ncbi:MAG: YggS family pyridoxal phosphate-dependent enzyme [Candidatus Egerieousia sp.]|nr:YggS family pyridoxal phosphate-dependent enzyme [bacterium]MDY5255506.1 YggS family pyridoxal phosphate-dependent enzyme [Candidatus Egerieousia sp.]
MMIRDNLSTIRKELPSGVTLVAVSKFHPSSAIREAYEAGQRDFAESRPQELAAKAAELPPDIRWHFIGHLQRNKLKMVLPYAYLIHSVDSVKLLDEIQKFAAKENLRVRILLEVFISSDSTKQGFSFEEARNLISIFASQGAPPQCASPYPNIILCGLMGMASLTDDTERILAEFRSLKSLFDEARSLRATLRAAQDDDVPLREFEILSMGMSGDYPLAIEAGATHVRIGTAIFGPRV